MNNSKNNAKRVGIMTAVIAVFALIALLNLGYYKNGHHTPLLHFPTEAYLNLAFAIGWITRAPAWLAYLLAVVVFVIVAVGFYLIGYGLYKKLAK